MQEVQAIFTIFRFVYFTWIPVLCSVMPTFYWYSIDLDKELYFARFLFFSYMCKRNLLTFYSIYKFFIVQVGEWEKFLSTNNPGPFGISHFAEVYMFACLFYYIHNEPMCHKYHIEYSDDSLEQVDCKFYRENLLPFFLMLKQRLCEEKKRRTRGRKI